MMVWVIVADSQRVTWTAFANPATFCICVFVCVFVLAFLADHIDVGSRQHVGKGESDKEPSGAKSGTRVHRPGTVLELWQVHNFLKLTSS